MGRNAFNSTHFPEVASLAADVAMLWRVANVILCLGEDPGDSRLSEAVLSHQLLDHIYVLNVVQEHPLNLEATAASDRLVLACPQLALSSLREGDFQSNFHWLLPLSPDLEDRIEGLPLRLDSNFFTYDSYDSELGVADLREWYKARGGPPMSNTLGRWSEEEGGFLDPVPFVWDRRKNLGGAALKVGTVVTEGKYDPHPMFSIDGASGEALGAIPEMAEALALTLNFTMDRVAMEDGQYGALVEGNWTGLVGQLQQRNIDFDVATFERLQTIISALLIF